LLAEAEYLKSAALSPPFSVDLLFLRGELFIVKPLR
jgi:hypothetical protein